MLEIGRGNRPANYDLFYLKSEPFVPRHLRFEVTERISPDGAVLTPLDETGLEQIAQTVREQGLEALAICFLHAYANAAHEEKARERQTSLLPSVYLCTSSEVAREFERTSTTVLNAFVEPKSRAPSAARCRSIWRRRNWSSAAARSAPGCRPMC